MSRVGDVMMDIAPEEVQAAANAAGQMRGNGLRALSPSEQTNVLLKYIPEDQPSPRAWLELIKTQIIGVDNRGNPRPIEDLLFFLHACNRTNLDPLARQIYAVYRWDGRLGREKMAVQISIDGMRLVAQRSGFYGGQDDAKFVPEDESAEQPTKATVTVYRLNPRTGRRMPVTASARWNEYVPLGRDGSPSGLWGKMPYLMLGKVAEALALRKAFPQELSGMYSAEEMEQSEPGSLPDLPRPAITTRLRVHRSATPAGEEKTKEDAEKGDGTADESVEAEVAEMADAAAGENAGAKTDKKAHAKADEGARAKVNQKANLKADEVIEKQQQLKAEADAQDRDED